MPTIGFEIVKPDKDATEFNRVSSIQGKMQSIPHKTRKLKKNNPHSCLCLDAA